MRLKRGEEKRKARGKGEENLFLFTGLSSSSSFGREKCFLEPSNGLFLFFSGFSFRFQLPFHFLDHFFLVEKVRGEEGKGGNGNLLEFEVIRMINIAGIVVFAIGSLLF